MSDSYFVSAHDSSSISFDDELGIVKNYNEFTKSFKNKYVTPDNINEAFLTGDKIESLELPKEVGQHHLFHAFSAMYSKYKSGVNYAVVVDGYGNELGGKVFKIYYQDKELKVDVLYEDMFKTTEGGLNTTIGQIWNDIGTRHFGYKDFPNNGKAGTLMARASLGEVKFEYLRGLNLLRNKGEFPYIVENVVDGAYQVEDSLFKSKPTEEELNDLCASLQYFTNMALLEIFKTVPSNVKQVYFAGGVAHNVSSIKFLEDTLDIEILTGFAQGDEGISLGYEFYNFARNNVLQDRDYQSPFSFVAETVYPQNEVIYDDLVKHGVVLNYCGAPEIGNRALGHRSFFALPTYPNIKESLDELKQREQFRPYGIVILKEDVLDWCEKDIDAPYMNKLVTPNNRFKELMPDIVHHDNTIRVQTVSKKLYPELHALLAYMKQKTGVPILINTSLNIDTPMLYKNDEGLAKEIIQKVKVGYINGERFTA